MNRTSKPLLLAAALLVLAAGGCKKDEPGSSPRPDFQPLFDPAAGAPDGGGFVRPAFVGDAGRDKIVVDPANPESLYLAGQHEFIAGEFDQAAEHLRRALVLKPSAKAWHALGDVQLAQARFTDAAAAFRSALEIEPAKRMSWMRLGRCLINNGRPSEAVEAYRKAQALQPGDATAVREEVEALINAERDEEAIAALERALLLDPEGAAADLKLIGQLRARRGELAPAIEAFRRSAERHPDGGIYGELGDALVRSGDLPAARDAFAEAARLDPKDPYAPELVGEIELRLGDREAAARAFAAALKVQDRPLPHLALGRLHLAAGRQEQARAEFDRALTVATGEQAAESREIARYATELGEWDAAEKLLAMLIAEESGAKDPSLWLELATARQALNRPEGVEQACQSARALLPAGASAACPPKAPAVVGER